MAARTVPRIVRRLPQPARAVDVLGGQQPVTTEEFAERAYLTALNPLRNPLKEVMDAYRDVWSTPPMLGIFSDVPVGQIRESEVQCWARAGFSWVVCDGEHSQSEGRYGREQLSMMLRLGITPIQRLHREARSEHGDALTLGARGSMAPYGTTVAEAKEFFQCVSYPSLHAGTKRDRGGYPMRAGDREMYFTPDALRAAETETQGWVQFETTEYIQDTATRDAVLDVMQAQGLHKASGFIGPFDAVMRAGPTPEMAEACNALLGAAANRGIFMGRVCGSGACKSEAEIEDTMVEAIDAGCRLVCVHHVTSDLPYLGAATAARPFFGAAKRCGF
jgi:2-keto-3-deoxy-L-rhamnonate aldolase RhmA